MIIPVHRITHTDLCASHLGYRCNCDREWLGRASRFETIVVVALVVLVLVLLASVLR